MCLDHDPSTRPTAVKLLKHPFFKNCRGYNFLMKNVPPAVELVRSNETPMKHTRIRKLNEEGFELNAVGGNEGGSAAVEC